MKTIATRRTLGDIIRALEAHAAELMEEQATELTATRQQREALARLVSLRGGDAEAIVADLDEIDAWIEANVSWARDGWASKKAFQNWRSRVRVALRQFGGRVFMHFRKRSDYPRAWQDFINQIEAASDEGRAPEKSAARVACLVGWCAGRVESASEATQDDFDAVLEERRRATGAGGMVSPWSYARQYVAAAKRWNELVAAGVVEAATFTLDTERQGDYLRLDHLHPELQNELASYRDWLLGRTKAASDLTAEEAARAALLARAKGAMTAVAGNGNQPKSRKPVTLHRARDLELAIRATVTALVKLGFAELDQLTSIAEIATPQGAAALGLELLDRCEAGRNRSNTKTRYDMYGRLKDIAKLWCHADQETLDGIQSCIDELPADAKPANGMSQGRRQKVDTMLEPAALERWLGLGDELWARAMKRWEAGKHDRSTVALFELTLWCDILREMPVRIKNVALLRDQGDDRNLVVSPKESKRNEHRQRPTRVRIPSNELKNRDSLGGVPLVAVLSEELADRIRFYRANVRTLAARLYGDGNDDMLFPGTAEIVVGRGATAKTYTGCRAVGSVGSAFSEAMGREGLKDMTAHIARHVAVSMMLRRDPGLLWLAALILNDKPGTVEKFYLSTDGEGAFQRYHALLRKFAPRTAISAEGWKDAA